MFTQQQGGGAAAVTGNTAERSVAREHPIARSQIEIKNLDTSSMVGPMAPLSPLLLLLLAPAVRAAADEAAPSGCTAVADAASLLSAARDPEVGCVALASGLYAMPTELKLDRSVQLLAQPGATPTISGARNGGSVTVSNGLGSRNFGGRIGVPPGPGK